MEELRRTVSELKQQTKNKDKACSEIKRLKTIVTNQDQKVNISAENWPFLESVLFIHQIWTLCTCDVHVLITCACDMHVLIIHMCI